MTLKNKIVAVVNKQLPVGRALNTLGHLAIAMGAIHKREELELVDYQDKDGNCYPHISKMPFIILKTNSNKIRKLREQALEKEIKQLTFTDAMTIGSWDEQVAYSQTKSAEELNYYGILLFGDSREVTALTKMFSLYQ